MSSTIKEGKKRRVWWRRFALELVIGLALVAAVFWYQTRDLVSAGEPIPEFSIPLYNPGQPVKFVTNKDLLGKPTLLVFWAPYCSVCAAEAKSITSIYESKKEDVNVYAVALAYGDLAEVDYFIKNNGLDVPVLLGDPQMGRNFRIKSFPTAYFVSPTGEVKNQTVGYTSEMGMRTRLYFAGK